MGKHETNRPWPRGLRRPEAAAYVGVGGTKFDDWVARGIMPKPRHQDGVVVWDRLELDAAFDELPSEGESRSGWTPRDEDPARPAGARATHAAASSDTGSFQLPCCGGPMGPDRLDHTADCKWYARYGRRE